MATVVMVVAWVEFVEEVYFDRKKAEMMVGAVAL
jgi:hypothetical protein